MEASSALRLRLALPPFPLTPPLICLILSALPLATTQTPEAEGVVLFAQRISPLPPSLAHHSTQFLFRSSLNWLVITVTMTFSFTEKTKPQAPPSRHNDKKSRATPSSCGISIPGNRHPGKGKVALHGEAIAGIPPAEDSRHGDTTTSGSKQPDTSKRQIGTGGVEEAPPAQVSGVPPTQSSDVPPAQGNGVPPA